MKQNCERCDKSLSEDLNDVFICSYECTFCESCTTDVLFKICPNCGGELVIRPTRIVKE